VSSAGCLSTGTNESRYMGRMKVAKAERVEGIAEECVKASTHITSARNECLAPPWRMPLDITITSKGPMKISCRSCSSICVHLFPARRRLFPVCIPMFSTWYLFTLLRLHTLCTTSLLAIPSAVTSWNLLNAFLFKSS